MEIDDRRARKLLLNPGRSVVAILYREVNASRYTASRRVCSQSLDKHRVVQ